MEAHGNFPLDSRRDSAEPPPVKAPPLERHVYIGGRPGHINARFAGDIWVKCGHRIRARSPRCSPSARGAARGAQTPTPPRSSRRSRPRQRRRQAPRRWRSPRRVAIRRAAPRSLARHPLDAQGHGLRARPPRSCATRRLAGPDVIRRRAERCSTTRGATRRRCAPSSPTYGRFPARASSRLPGAPGVRRSERRPGADQVRLARGRSLQGQRGRSPRRDSATCSSAQTTSARRQRSAHQDTTSRALRARRARFRRTQATRPRARPWQTPVERHEVVDAVPASLRTIPATISPGPAPPPPGRDRRRGRR